LIRVNDPRAVALPLWRRTLFGCLIVAVLAAACAAAGYSVFQSYFDELSVRSNSLIDVLGLSENTPVNISGVVTFVNRATHEFFCRMKRVRWHLGLRRMSRDRRSPIGSTYAPAWRLLPIRRQAFGPSG
jgi:hypothetical protein